MALRANNILIPIGVGFAAYTHLHWLALGAFVLLTLVSYAAFVMKRER